MLQSLWPTWRPSWGRSKKNNGDILETGGFGEQKVMILGAVAERLNRESLHWFFPMNPLFQWCIRKDLTGVVGEAL
jgi:hypothetical protein